MSNKKRSSAEMDETLFAASAKDAMSPLDEETVELRQLFADMRENSALTASRHRAAAEQSSRRPASSPMKQRLAWGLSFAVIATAVAVPVELHHQKNANAVLAAQKESERKLAEQRTDEALLMNVESDLSSTVPQPLQPLFVKYVSATTSNTKGTNE